MSAPAKLVRAATLADVPRVVALVERAYRGEESRAGWTTEADLLDGQRTDAEDVEQALLAPGNLMLLVLEADALRASVLLKPQPDAVLLGMFAVEPVRQGSGLGRFLLERAQREMRERFAAARGRMTVIRQREELVAWYGRRGWHPTGAREPFPYGQPRFGEPRRDDLEFVVLEKDLAPA